MNVTLAQMRKALIAGAAAALTALLGFNYPDWIAGKADFDWRSVLAALIAAFIGGVATFLIPNAPATSAPPTNPGG